MNIDFGSGTIKITTKGHQSLNDYFKFYYGAIVGSVSPYNYNQELDGFLGLTIKINGDIYDIPDASKLNINGSYPGGAYDCINALVANFNVYTYTNPIY